MPTCAETSFLHLSWHGLKSWKRGCFTGCAWGARCERMQGFLGASGKVVWRWPPMGAADAGPMQIQLWEGVVLRCAEAALQGTACDSAEREVG